jgi:hypothetical protein
MFKIHIQSKLIPKIPANLIINLSWSVLIRPRKKCILNVLFSFAFYFVAHRQQLKKIAINLNKFNLLAIISYILYCEQRSKKVNCNAKLHRKNRTKNKEVKFSMIIMVQSKLGWQGSSRDALFAVSRFWIFYRLAQKIKWKSPKKPKTIKTQFLFVSFSWIGLKFDVLQVHLLLCVHIIFLQTSLHFVSFALKQQQIFKFSNDVMHSIYLLNI